jgi:para-aminobenzoate synthetase component 1
MVAYLNNIALICQSKTNFVSIAYKEKIVYKSRPLGPRQVPTTTTTTPARLFQTGQPDMDQAIIEELPYTLDSAPLFASIADLEQSVYLDSARPYSAMGRYDIFTAEPACTVEFDINTPRAGQPFFDDLRAALDEHTPHLNNDYHLPFVGGAVGFLGYDLGRQLETLPQCQAKTLTLPDAAMGLYQWAVIVDHRQQRALLVAHPRISTALLTELRQRLQSHQPQPDTAFNLHSPFTASTDRNRYNDAFARIQHYIHAGDCYQVNLSQHFSASYSGAPWQAYLAMRATAAAPFSAFMRHRNSTIMSLSPERFMHLGNQRVTTSPIKGTIARGDTPTTDRALAQQLLDSHKDRAENLMIVDLLRNDLGKSCLPGSIQVDELFELQSFDTVHHLVSTISGQLAPGQDGIQLLANCFPGGSITGAPKVRAMQIIEELESVRRGAYCGSIGYISCDGQMDFNIAIRTLLCEAGTIHCWAGGGIVADSDCTSEYQECFTKIEKLLAALPGSHLPKD